MTMSAQTTAKDDESVGQTTQGEGHAGLEFVDIRSIRPLFPLGPAEKDPVLVTERLFLRPLAASDLEALHRVRARPLVMTETSRGTPDITMDQTQAELDDLVPPPGVDRWKMSYALCLKQVDDTGTGADQCGELIGLGGIYHYEAAETGWPEMGYMLHDAYWGRGYMTEFVRGFLALYAALPRPAAPVPMRVNRITLGPEDLATEADDGVPVVEEKLTAIVADYNAGSRAVLRKAGFTEIAAYVEDSDPPCPVHVFQVHPGRGGGLKD